MSTTRYMALTLVAALAACGGRPAPVTEFRVQFANGEATWCRDMTWWNCGYTFDACADGKRHVCATNFTLGGANSKIY